MIEKAFQTRTKTSIYYIRYVDNWIIGITGSRKLAMEIMEKTKCFLSHLLKLQLNAEQIKLTNMVQNKINFLGVDIQGTNRKYTKSLRVNHSLKNKIITRPKTLSSVKFYIPIQSLINKLVNKGFAKIVKIPDRVKILKSEKSGKHIYIKIPSNKTKIVPCANTKLIQCSEIQMFERYEAILKGLINYYSFTDNYYKFNFIAYLLKYSLICTISRKRGLTTKKVIKKHGKNLTINLGNGSIRTLKFESSFKRNNGKNINLPNTEINI